MNATLEFCLARRKAERPAFVRVMKALPADKLDYKPDPRSRSAVELAWVIASEEGDILSVLQTGVIDWKETKGPATVAEILAIYERDAAAVDAALATLDDAAWARPAKFLMGGAPVWEDVTERMVWGFLFDAIHHRGQLSTYIRPMGGKVPSIYGPSADDAGQ